MTSPASPSVADGLATDAGVARDAFRLVVSRGIALDIPVRLIHAVLLFSAAEATWMMSALGALCSAGLFAITGPKRTYSVFLAGLFSMIVLAAGYLTWLTWSFGRGAGFHYLMLVIAPWIMVSGRLNSWQKWSVALISIAYVLALDNAFTEPAIAQPLNASLLFVMRAFNIAALVVWTALMMQYFYGIVVSTQGQLMEVAFVDPLTKLLNRRRFLEIAAKQQALSQRYGWPMAVILADLDRFKAINDRFGHKSGDTVLCEVSRLIREAGREADSVCRWGGEEFLVLLPNTSLEGAMTIAQRICSVVAANPVEIEGSALPVTITLGVAQWRAEEPLGNAVSRADVALYEGKAAGRNRVVLAQA